MPLHVSSTRAHRQEVKIILYSLWYHHTYRWPSGARDVIMNVYVGHIIAHRVENTPHFMKATSKKHNCVASRMNLIDLTPFNADYIYS